MKSLYAINLDYLKIVDQLEENGGEFTPEVEKGLEIHKEELESKSLSYIEFIGDRSAFVNRIDEEIKRLQGIKKANSNLIDRLKDNLETAVKIYGEFTTGTYNLKLRKSESVIINEESKIPAEFIKVKTEPMKAEIKKALKEGKEVPGAELKVNQNLSIK